MTTDNDHHGYLLVAAATGEPIGYRRLLDHAWQLATAKKDEGEMIRVYAVTLKEVALFEPERSAS